MANQSGGNSTLDQLAAEKQETTGAPSRPLPTDEDGIPFQPEEQKMSRENAHDDPAAEHDKKKLNSLKADKHTVYVDRELKTWHSKWFEVWKDPVTTAYGCCLPCALVGQNVNRVSDGSSGFWKPFLIECVLLGPVLGWAYTFSWRRKLRDQNDLQPEPFNDCLTAFLCHQCALCQEQREIKATESGAIQGPTKATVDRGPSGRL
jgi:Cys-rich protein (TIGR01571 family)